eukprot:gene4515-7893_t
MRKNFFCYSKLIQSLHKKQIFPDENQRKLVQKFENLELKKFSKGLYIYGSVGTGKTSIMDTFFQICQISSKKRTHFHKFMMEMHKKIHQLRSQNELNYFNIIAQEIMNESWLLFFDEMQVTDIADSMMIKRLFNELFELGVVIITTSNRHPNELYKDGINREFFLPFINKLQAHCEIFNLTNEFDYRKKNFVENSFKIYSYPLNESNKMELENIFHSYGAIETQKEIISFGRKILIPRVRGDTCSSFTFDEICGSDRFGYSDFIELTNHFNTFIISNIPQLIIRLENHDPRITKFIILIDILYENKMRIYLNCEKSINELFVLSNDNFIEYDQSRSKITDLRGDVSLTDTMEDGAPIGVNHFTIN